MKLSPWFSAFLFLLIPGIASHAQSQTITAKGKLVDNVEKSPVRGAQINLFSKKDSLVSFHAVTDSAGIFSLPGINPDTFLLSIHATGYEASNKIWIITDSSADAGTISINKPGSTINPSISQVNTSVTGILQDKTDKTPLYGATVNIRLKKDSAVQHNVVSDSKGVFSFPVVPADTVILSVSSIGYEFVDQQISLSDSANNLGVILIPKSTKQLEGVTVIAKTPPAQQKGDTIQYNASAFKVNPDATTEDLIKKMPGITVDKDGTVTAHGDQVKKVTIDGKDFLGDDATAALRNLPSEVVDKIQVFDRLSDQAAFTGFDDGNSVKSINIVTKSGIKNGQFGRIYAGYGTNDRYSAGGNVSKFDGNRRISVVGSFNNINQQNFSSQDLLGVTSGGGGGNFGGGGGRGGNRGGGGAARGGGNNQGGGGNTNNFTVGQQPGISTTNAIGINYTDKWSPKLDMQASYFFNNNNSTNDQLLRSQTLIGAKTQFTDQNSITTSKNYNHRFNMRLEYKFDSSNSLIINPSLNFQRNNTVSSGTSQTYYGAGDTSNTSDSRSAVERNGYNLRNNILYRHSFAKKVAHYLSISMRYSIKTMVRVIYGRTCAFLNPLYQLIHCRINLQAIQPGVIRFPVIFLIQNPLGKKDSYNSVIHLPMEKTRRTSKHFYWIPPVRITRNSAACFPISLIIPPAPTTEVSVTG